MLKSFSRTCVPRCNRRKERKFSKNGDFGRGGSLRSRRKENQVEKKQGEPNSGPRKGYNILGLRTAGPASALPADSPPAAVGPSPHLRPRAVLSPRPARLLLPLPLFPAAEPRARLLLPAAENREAPRHTTLFYSPGEGPSAGRSIPGPGSGALGSAAGGKGRARPRLRWGERRWGLSARPLLVAPGGCVCVCVEGRVSRADEKASGEGGGRAWKDTGRGRKRPSENESLTSLVCVLLRRELLPQTVVGPL